jgi:transcriptional regulator with XRE-family HTH domain
MATVFFQRVEALCKEKNMTTTDLGPAAGIGNGTVSGWRKGAEPSLSSIAKVADFFNVAKAYLQGETDDPINYASMDTSGFNQPVYENFLKKCKGNVEQANREYVAFEQAQAQDALSDPDRLAIYNHGQNSWAIGHAHTPIEVNGNGGNGHTLTTQEQDLLRIFATLSETKKAKVLIFAEELQDK